MNVFSDAYAVIVRQQGFVDRFLVEGADPAQPLDGRECMLLGESTRFRAVRVHEFATRAEAQTEADRFNAALDYPGRRYVVAARRWEPVWVEDAGKGAEHAPR